MNTHWSRNALTVKIAGVNAICGIPLILVVIRPFNWLCIALFLVVLIYFVATENIFKLKPKYTLDALRCLVLGTERNVKNREIDF